jgi:hypothetical protein
MAEDRMSIVALITWIMAAACGLFLVSIWLIEYDKEFQTAARTRLPPLVLASHVTAAAGGLVIWVAWLIFGAHNLAWFAVLALVLAATLGGFMAIRWIGVYREVRAIGRAAAEQRAVSPPRVAGQLARGLAGTAASRQFDTLDRPVAGPPERNFPLPVVVAHGAFAVATLTVVLLVALGSGGS